MIIEKTITTYVEPLSSVQLGHATLFISMAMLLKNFEILFNYKILPFQYAIFNAGVTGLEPATPGFGDRCSTN